MSLLVSSRFGSLADAVAMDPGNPITWDVDIEFVEGDLTIPPNVSLRFIDGGKISVGVDKMVLIQGSISAPDLMHIFGGAGKVKFVTPPALVYPTWFGAKPDDMTDCADAIEAAIKCWHGETYRGPHLKFQVGKFSSSRTIDVTQRCVIEGSGAYQRDGSTALTFPINTTGIKIWRGGDSPDGSGGGDWSVIRNLLLQPQKPKGPYGEGDGPTGDEPPHTTGHGVLLNAPARLEGTKVVGFAEHGIFLHSPIRGTHNADDTVAIDCYASNCGGDGFRCDGEDTQAGSFIHCVAVTCGGAGFNDSSMLGNSWYQCHANENRGPCYKTGRPTSYPVFVSCYVEGDPPPPEQMPVFVSRPLVLGGSLALWAIRTPARVVSNHEQSALTFESFRHNGLYRENMMVPYNDGILGVRDTRDGDGYARVEIEVTAGPTDATIKLWDKFTSTPDAFPRGVGGIPHYTFLAIENARGEALPAAGVTVPAGTAQGFICIAAHGGKIWNLPAGTINSTLVGNIVNVVQPMAATGGEPNLRYWTFGLTPHPIEYPSNPPRLGGSPLRGKWTFKSTPAVSFFITGNDDLFMEPGQFGFESPIADSRQFVTQYDEQILDIGQVHTFEFEGAPQWGVKVLQNRNDEDFVALTNIRAYEEPKPTEGVQPVEGVKIVAEWLDPDYHPTVEHQRMYYVRVRNDGSSRARVKCGVLFIARAIYR